MALNDDKELLEKLISGLRIYADSQPAIRGVVLNRMLDMISALMKSILDRLEKLDRGHDGQHG